ncbi:MAG: transposase [Chitinophagales bacterium]|nr:transposase [Chitinophagales bacterium]
MRYKILDQQGLNFLTCRIVEWIDIFSNSTYRDIVIDSLRFCQKEKGLILNAYVIMSNHIHLIARTDEKKGLSTILQQFKSFTAKEILNRIQDWNYPESRREWLLNHFAFNARKNRTGRKHQVWRHDNHPIALYSPKVIRQKLAYIHLNPVKAKIVTEPEYYMYSSASNYAGNGGLLEVSILDDIWNDIGFINMGI